MNNIKELMNAEKGNNLIIIGGGPSVNELILEYKFCIGRPNQRIMAINFFHELNLPVHYNIYQDGIYKEYLENQMIQIPFGTALISLKEQACSRTEYYFSQNDMIIPGTHTGFVALQIADKILNPDKIFLIGFDYYMENERIHYYDKYFNEFGKLQRLRYASAFKGMLGDFTKVQWNKERIFNLNPNSKLKL